MIAELSAAMAAIKETAGLAKAINDANTDAEIKSATSEIQSKLLSLQAECFNLSDVIRLKEEEISLLKAKIAEFENFKSESEGYVLHRTEGETIVYAKQVSVGDTQFTVNACPHCYHQKKISMLQPGIQNVTKAGYWVHFCPSCKAEFKMNKTPSAKNAASQSSQTRFYDGGSW